VQWKEFVYQGKTYDLSHLHPFEVHFERPAQDSKPPVKFRVEVHFSLHCFSRRLGDEGYDKNLIYPCVSEVRLFDLYRYELSRRLPDILRGLPNRQIRQTGHGNYICVEVITETGARVEYDVFFKVGCEGPVGIARRKLLCARPELQDEPAVRQADPLLGDSAQHAEWPGDSGLITAMAPVKEPSPKSCCHGPLSIPTHGWGPFLAGSAPQPKLLRSYADVSMMLRERRRRKPKMHS